MNINIMYDKANFNRVHLLNYYVCVNPTYVSTRFDNFCISVLEFLVNLSSFLFNSLKERTKSHNLNPSVLQTALGINVGPQELK
jgi:hypothetical protein